MNKTIRIPKLFFIAAVVLTPLLALFVSVSPAKASGSYPCSRSGCYGVDPYSVYGSNGLNCASNLHEISTTLKDSQGHTLATLWNDYSIPCVANWSQAQLSSYSLQQHYKLIVYTNEESYPYEQQCYPDNCGPPAYGGSAIAWTNMVDGTSYVDTVVGIRSGPSDMNVVATNYQHPLTQ